MWHSVVWYTQNKYFELSFGDWIFSCLQVKCTQWGPVHRASPCLWIGSSCISFIQLCRFHLKIGTEFGVCTKAVSNAHKHSSCDTGLLSQTCRPYFCVGDFTADECSQVTFLAFTLGRCMKCSWFCYIRLEWIFSALGTVTAPSSFS
jgi:hypothetical protein